MSDSKYTYYLPDQKDNNRYTLKDYAGNDVYQEFKEKYGLYPLIMQQAVDGDQALRFNKETEKFRRADKQKYYDNANSSSSQSYEEPTKLITPDYANTDIPDEQKDVKSFMRDRALSLKPDKLYMDDLLWKYLLRNVLRSQNTMMLGPTGSGKTVTVKWVAEALDRPFFTFNLGATQDPRGMLIGNTHFDKDKGTFFSESPFIKAIQTPHAVIRLDELSRANPEASNILMTVLDEEQRYVRLGEAKDSPTIDVHPTVTFLATANVGHEYTATRVMDRALTDRFVTVEMEYLSAKDEFSLLTDLFPDVSKHKRTMIAKAVGLIRDDVKSEDGQLEQNVSTRHSIEMASLLNDGFEINEALELVAWPLYDTTGGMDSDRSYVKKLVQSVITSEPENLDSDADGNDPFPNF